VSQVRVVVGSKNPAKLEGVERAFRRFFESVEVSGANTDSGVGKQPFGTETIFGAINRAKGAYSRDYDFSVGVEAGLFPMPETLTGYVDFQVACVYDGKLYTLGFGPGFEYPPDVVCQVRRGSEVGKVMERLSRIENLGEKHGSIGYLTRNSLKRRDLTEIAVTMALVPWINRALYKI